MPCLIALIILSILGIFSASHRKLAREAFDCVFRRVTLRPCNTGFDVKVKTSILGPILPRFPKLAKFVGRYFEVISWVFMLVMTLSFAWTLKGFYNFYAWGDCNGPYATGSFCAFDPTGANSKTSTIGEGCKDVALASKILSLKDFDVSLFSGGQETDVIMFGCYSCDYTRKTYPLIKSILADNPANFTFAHFPVKGATEYLLPYDVCVASQSATLYAQYLDMLFSSPKLDLDKPEYVDSRLASLGVNLPEFKLCLQNPETQKLVQKQQSEILSTGIYGTPTVFINGTPVVGPKPERVYRRLLRGSWF